jgi:hypothetical protein
MATDTIGLAGVIVPEGYVDLGPHDFEGGERHTCANCGVSSVPTWESYEAYVEHFYAEEWEGERHHKPYDEELYVYLGAACSWAGGVENATQLEEDHA